MLQLFHEAEKVLLGETSDYNVVLRLIGTRHSTSRQFDKAEHRLYFWICRILQPAPPLPPQKNLLSSTLTAKKNMKPPTATVLQTEYLLTSSPFSSVEC